VADPESPSFPAHGPVSASRLNQRSQALLRECFGQFVGRLHKAVHISVHATNDLFDFNEHVSMREVADFRVRRDQWLLEYERTLRMLYVRRIGGTPRSGRRPDPESAPPTFHLLDPLDQEMQVALIRKVKDLQLAWERLLETAISLGDQRIYASHKSIMFSRQSCYFFVRPKRKFLELCVFLGRELNSPQVRRVDRASKSKIVHIIQIRHRDEVETPVTDWLREAYKLSGALASKAGAKSKPVSRATTKPKASRRS